MERSEFWEIIQQGQLLPAGSVQSAIDRVQQLLSSLPDEELIAFQQYFDGYKALAEKPLVIGLAALCMGCGSPDDCDDILTYFLDLLVLASEEIYHKTLVDPNSFGTLCNLDLGQEYDLETLNCLTYDLLLLRYPTLDYRDAYLQRPLSPAALASMKDAIEYHPQIGTPWRFPKDLQPLLPLFF